MTTRRHTSGFTMMEMMAAIVILIIVAALMFVGFMQYMRTMHQREVDETAKEIYIAAQNHLTIAESLGTLSAKSDKGTQDAGNIYYYVVNEGNTSLNSSSSVLNTMLPPYSIDGTVRDGGSYVIQYELTGSSASVLNVFYAKPSGRYSHVFSNGEYRALIDNYTGDSKSDERQHYPDGGDAIIGWYGGDGAQGGGETVTVPSLQVINAEMLYATITNASVYTNGEKLEIYITGEKSGAVYGPYPITSGDDTFFIDDITTTGRHFAELNEESSKFADAKRFIPGEDVTVQAFALSKNSTKIAKSAKRTTNSLFASVNTMSADALPTSGLPSATTVGEALSALSASSSYYAKISNIRHLENMSEAISGYDAEAIADLGTKVPIAYEQTANLSWSDFRKNINSSNSANVRVYDLAGNASNPGTFAPVTPSTSVKQDYRGHSHQISDVAVSWSSTSNGGIFGSLQNANVSDLEIVNFNIGTQKTANAGALAGTATNTTITGVLAHHDANSNSYAVSGTANVGGLVGSMTGGSITRSAAAMIVQSSGSAAGGLVGSASGTSISQSYAGGHTSNGAYSSSSFNVSADEYAGGLVGAASNCAITSCYSTCSASADTAGGLIGNMTGSSSLANAYATGLTDADTRGTLVGNLGDGATLSQTGGYYPAYLSSVDAAATAVGSDEDFANATVAESSTGAYEATVAGALTAANPYDSWLRTNQQSKCPYKTIKQLAGLSDDSLKTGFSKHLEGHYGDWPAIEIMLVNKK